MSPHVIVDGERWDKYFANYQHDGKTYSFDFFARTEEEAVATLRSIRTTAVECQKIHGEISASVPGAGWFVKLTCAVRNIFAV